MSEKGSGFGCSSGEGSSFDLTPLTLPAGVFLSILCSPFLQLQASSAQLWEISDIYSSTSTLIVLSTTLTNPCSGRL